ncbi:MAG TPA: hypothetical protein VHL34_24735 [Rhizomicrobium sp.]|nr:hypothetical protein [Rhizomicrobium sp.]
MKVVINRCFGGFGLSDAAYEQLIAWGVPVRAYVEQTRNAETGLYEPQPLNDGEVIFDRELTPEGASDYNDIYWKFKAISDRYWDCWTRENRTHPLLVRLVEEMGSEAASGRHGELAVVEVPDGVEFTIEDYDGREHIAETHRTWE